MLLANFNRKEHLRHRAVSLRQHGFLVIRTYYNGRAYATVLLLSVTYVLWLNGASWGKSYYWQTIESRIGTKINDLDLCLEVESRSCQPLRCIQRSLSLKPLEIEAWFQRTTNRKWHMGYQLWCEAVRSAILATAWLLVFIFCYFWCAMPIMPLIGVINYVFAFILAVLSPVSVIWQG